MPVKAHPDLIIHSCNGLSWSAAGNRYIEVFAIHSVGNSIGLRS